MTLDIRPIGPDDIAGYHAALDAVCREGKYLSRLTAPPLEETRKFANGNIEAGNPHFVVVAEGRIVGWCDIQRHEAPFFAHTGGLGMGLLAEFREQGIGRRLIEVTVEDAWTRGFTRVELHVFGSNERAIRLYEKVGFVHEGRFTDAIKVEDGYQDMLSMAMVRR
jgi:RimJ/RimL family protein N-acetyltransferase